MTIALQGTLRVKSVTGRNGPFNTGDLETQVGKFRIKDAVLDQFKPGIYTGRFHISEIFNSSYVASSGYMIIELRARIESLQIDDEDTSNPPKASSPELDPADEQGPLNTELPEATPLAPTPPKSLIKRIRRIPAPGAKLNDERDAGAGQASSPAESVPEQPPESCSEATDADRDLFGQDIAELIKQGQPLKLDPTVDRMLLRRQASRLNELGYSFKSPLQTWFPSSAE